MSAALLLPFLPPVLLLIFGFLLLGVSAAMYLGLLCIGIALVYLAYLLLHRLKKHRARLARRLWLLLTVCLLLFALAFGATEGVILSHAHTQTQAVDYLIVLGAQMRGRVPSRALEDRLRAAADYLNAYPDVICIVSGGQGSGEEISEAACMAQYLQAAGISAERIWQEDCAENTRENLLFSLALIAERTGAQPELIGVLSSEYHLYRAKRLAQSLGVSAVGVAAPTSLPYAKVNYFLREAVAVWYTWLFE